MTDGRTTRRRFLGTLSVALAGGTAGCSGVLGGQDATEDGDSGTSTPTRATSTATDGGRGATGSTSRNVSPYTRAYRATVGSVVLIRVRTGEGGGQGSGFVFRGGHVVTNEHVVGDATDIRVRFARGQWRSASVVGTDVSSDLAVIEVSNPPGYADPLRLVANEPAIGTEVVAIGNPFGAQFEGSVSAGIVSGVNRSIPAQNGYTIPGAIQTDAAVNPGNSGGPLVTLDGRVVGVINSGGGENIAFAISAALVRRVVPGLIRSGEYEHAYLGVRLATVTPAIAERVGLARPRGVLVGEVLSNGPSAGTLGRGDVVLALDGRRIDTREGLSSYLALQTSPGDAIEITVRRDGQRRTVRLELGARPEQSRPGGRTTTPRR